MDLNRFEKELKQKMEDVKRFAAADLPLIIGVEAVNHFKESFEKEGFVDDTSLEKWQNVKRRDPQSPWFGFAPGSSSNKKNNFSTVRTMAKILTGETGELANAITYKVSTDKVVVSNDKPYAAVHNFGGKAKIFGKTEFQMPARKFMGKSIALEKNINEKMKREIIKILKR